jgi:hypothetical protein
VYATGREYQTPYLSQQYPPERVGNRSINTDQIELNFILGQVGDFQL